MGYATLLKHALKDIPGWSSPEFLTFDELAALRELGGHQRVGGVELGGAVEALDATAAATSPQSVAESNAAHADGVQEPQGSALDADAGMKDAVFDNVDDIDFENIDPHLVRA